MLLNYGKVLGKTLLGFALFFACNLLLGIVLSPFVANSSYYSSQLGLVVASYLMFILFERKQNWNLGWIHQKWLSSLVLGIVAAFLIPMITCLLLLGIGFVSFEMNQWETIVLLGEGLLFLLVAVGEETFFRGYLFGMTQHTVSTRAAIVITSVVFAVVHLINPGAFDKPLEFIVVEIANIFLLGLIFAIARIVSGNLWLPIGLHFMFNFTQSSIFGFLNGGKVVESFLEVTYNSQSIWNGSTYGLESSLILTIILLDFLLLLGILSKKHNRKKVTGTIQ